MNGGSLAVGVVPMSQEGPNKITGRGGVGLERHLSESVLVSSLCSVLECVCRFPAPIFVFRKGRNHKEGGGGLDAVCRSPLLVPLLTECSGWPGRGVDG